MVLLRRNHPRARYMWVHIVLSVAVQALMMSTDYSEVDMTGMRISVHSLPVYHGLGIIQSFWAVSHPLCSCYALCLILSLSGLRRNYTSLQQAVESPTRAYSFRDAP